MDEFVPECGDESRTFRTALLTGHCRRRDRRGRCVLPGSRGLAGRLQSNRFAPGKNAVSNFFQAMKLGPWEILAIGTASVGLTLAAVLIREKLSHWRTIRGARKPDRNASRRDIFNRD
jgi:hypothetical protein